MIDELLMPRTTEETIPQQYQTARRKPLPDLGGAATSDKVEQNVLTLERRRRGTVRATRRRKADAPALGRASRGGVSEGFWNRAFAPKPALPSARADPGKSVL